MSSNATTPVASTPQDPQPPPGSAGFGSSSSQPTTASPYPFTPTSSGTYIYSHGGLAHASSASGLGPSTNLTKRESYKDRRKTYQIAKKKVAEELLSTISDPTVVVMADWLKVRGTLKGWTKIWCELKPGLIVLYKSPKTHKSGVWVGTVLLNVCEVIERPSKKDGFCFKLFHPLQESIWASRGPKGESFGAIIQPLPMAYLIFRAPSEEAGHKWMEAIELSYRASSILVRNSGALGPSDHSDSFPFLIRTASQDDGSPPPSATLKLNESEIEKHFEDHDLDDEDEFHTDQDDTEPFAARHHSGTDTDSDVLSIQEQMGRKDGDVSRPLTARRRSSLREQDDVVVETPYAENTAVEEFGSVGDQTEEVAEENKGLLWTLLKQVRPGMDLSKVVLPTFILETRSFLEKLSDYYYHSDILSKAALDDDPFARMKCVVKWYLSGFYKKPKGLKKPYNPILGETFRCYWSHPETKSRTFYICEQISHHPPISAFYVTNRKDGFCISGSILAKSKFYGNSVSAILDGTARITLLTRGEDYTLTMPYAHCKGILMGTLSLEYGGKVEINCEKTGYFTEMEFKLKPFLGGAEYSNLLVGKIKLGKETLASVEGHWDELIKIKDKKTGAESVLWEVSPEVKASRLKRYTVPMEHQDDFESEKLWRGVTASIVRQDQVAATEEKTILEEEQRRAAKERAAKCEIYMPKNFVQDMLTGEWIYKQVDSRPWDPRTDVLQFERNYQIQTKTRHKTPTVAVRTNSIASIETAALAKSAKEEILRRVGSVERSTPFSSRPTSQSRMSTIGASKDSGEGESSSPESKTKRKTKKSDGLDDSTNETSRKVLHQLRDMVKSIKETQRETQKSIKSLETSVELVSRNQRELVKSCGISGSGGRSPENRASGGRSISDHFKILNRFASLADIVIIVIIALLTQILFNAIGNWR